MKKFFYLFLIFIQFSSCSKRNEKIIPPPSKIAMNTVCTVNAYDDGTENLYEEIFSRLFEIEKTFSVTIDNSEISIINKNAGSEKITASDNFIFVLKTAVQVSKISDGAFNPALGNLISLWGINTENARVPNETQIYEALKNIDYEKIKIYDNEIHIPENTNLNLSGIAKGYAADCIKEILEKKNVKKAIVDLGGNILIYGKKENNLLWNVGIKNPNDLNGTPLLKLTLPETSIVTSGTYERFFEENGKIYHHIFDSETGFPCENDISSVTVICSSSMIADCLSTTMFVMGIEKSFENLDKFMAEFKIPISIIFIKKDGTVFASKDLKDKIDFVKKTNSKITFI